MARLLTVLPVAAGALALGACGTTSATAGDAGPATTAAAKTVTIKTFNFQPDPLRVKRGTRVTWVNEDSAVHTVTSGTRGKRTRLFNKRLAESGGRFSYTFRKKGTFRYFCALHPGSGMTAKVVVR